MDSNPKPTEPSQETASLVHRLAGPSTGKAGLVHNINLPLYFAPTMSTDGYLVLSVRLAKDETEINRIIAEASKGSKFYEVMLLSCSAEDQGIHHRTYRTRRRKTRILQNASREY